MKRCGVLNREKVLKKRCEVNDGLCRIIGV
jgi:hypothetical protein